MLTLSLDIISKIVKTPSGVVIAATICANIREGIQYQLPDQTPITTTVPSSLVTQLQEWAVENEIITGIDYSFWVKDRDRDYNQVAAFFNPQVKHASVTVKHRLLLDLLDYAAELATQI